MHRDSTSAMLWIWQDGGHIYADVTLTASGEGGTRESLKLVLPLQPVQEPLPLQEWCIKALLEAVRVLPVNQPADGA